MKSRGGVIAAVAAMFGLGAMALGGTASAKGSGGSGGGGASGGGGPGSGGGGSSGGGAGGGGSGGSGSGGGGSGGSGSGGELDEPWTPGPGGGGRVYGSGQGWPGDFDFSGNGLWISPDCSVVAEGAMFREGHDDWISAIEPDGWPGYTPGREVEAVLEVAPDNQIAGFVDWAMGNPLPDHPAAFEDWVISHFKAVVRPRPSTSAVRIVAELIRQVSDGCLFVGDFDDDWGEGLTAWIEDFFLWVDLYLHEWWSDDIDFDPTVHEPEMDDGPPIPDVE